VTGYQQAGNYRLRGQKVRGEVECRGTSVFLKVDIKRLGLVKHIIEISGEV